MSLTAKLTNLDGLEAVAHGYLADQPIREAASELNLSHVIHGTVLKSSDRCRVIVNLIHASEGTQMWAREYDFDAGEMFPYSRRFRPTCRTKSPHISGCITRSRPVWRWWPDTQRITSEIAVCT